jgi:transcriptional regulator with XRE-family HTH domain
MNKNDKKNAVTQELFHKLEESKHIDEFLQKNEDEVNNIDIQTYLYKGIEQSGYTIPQIIEKASISKSLAYQVFNGQRTPNRNLLIRIAFILKLDLDETQRMLRISKKGELYPRIQRDAAIIFSIQHNYSLFDCNELLESLHEAALLKAD